MLSGSKDDRRGIAGSVILALPGHFAAVLVESDHGSAFGADVDQNFIVFDERRARDAENQVGGALDQLGLQASTQGFVRDALAHDASQMDRRFESLVAANPDLVSITLADPDGNYFQLVNPMG